MKSILYKIIGAITILCLVATTSCKKDNDNGLDFGNTKSELSMEVDGKPWKAKFATTMTLPPEDESDDYYFVTINATEIQVDASDEIVGDTEGLYLWFAIPKTKFNNPKGEYKFTNMGDELSPEFPAFAIYSTLDGSGNDYKLFSTVNGGESAGSIKIDGFKTGKQEFLGHVLSEKDGYTNLSGTFSMNMVLHSEADGSVIKTIKITNGKFNVSSGFSLGSLFGKFPKMGEKFTYIP